MVICKSCLRERTGWRRKSEDVRMPGRKAAEENKKFSEKNFKKVLTRSKKCARIIEPLKTERSKAA